MNQVQAAWEKGSKKKEFLENKNIIVERNKHTYTHESNSKMDRTEDQINELNNHARGFSQNGGMGKHQITRALQSQHPPKFSKCEQ